MGAIFLGDPLSSGTVFVTPVMVGDNWGEFGRNQTILINNFYLLNTTLDQTTYADWTASTTAGAISTSTVATTFNADFLNYEYIIEWVWDINIAHLADQTLKAVPIRQCGYLYQIIYKKASNLTNLQNGVSNLCYSQTLTSSVPGYIYYRNTSGNLAGAVHPTYGIYAVVTNATFSNTSASNPTVTVNTPVITARSSSSYFATARKPYVDAANTIIKIKGANIYQVDGGTSELSMKWHRAMDLYNNPL